MDVDHHEMVESPQRPDRLGSVGLGLRRVLTDDEQRTELAALHRLEHLAEVAAGFGGEPDVPGLLELGPGIVVGDVLEAGETVGKGTHVAASLHVVLAAQRGEARPVAADLTGQQGEVAQREHVVDAVVVLGDAEGPADLRRVGARVGVGQFGDGVAGNARDLAAAFERPGLDRLGERVEPLGRSCDEVGVRETGVDDLAGDRVGECDVRTDLETEPPIGELCGLGPAWVDHVQTGAAVDGSQHVMEVDRVGVAGVRSPHDDDVGMLHLLVRRRPAARSEDRGQTDHRGCVSSSIAAVDVVRVERGTGQLLDQEVQLVRRLRAREHPDRRSAVGREGLAETLGSARASASSQPAGRRRSPSRTIGSVSRGSGRC